MPAPLVSSCGFPLQAKEKRLQKGALTHRQEAGGLRAPTISRRNRPGLVPLFPVYPKAPAPSAGYRKPRQNENPRQVFRFSYGSVYNNPKVIAAYPLVYTQLAGASRRAFQPYPQEKRPGKPSDLMIWITPYLYRVLAVSLAPEKGTERAGFPPLLPVFFRFCGTSCASCAPCAYRARYFVSSSSGGSGIYCKRSPG